MIRASLCDQSIHPSGEILSGQLFFVLKVPHKIRALFVKHMRISREDTAMLVPESPCFSSENAMQKIVYKYIHIYIIYIVSSSEF